MAAPQFPPQKRPVFKSRSEHYEIDTCAPQNKAIESGKVSWHSLTKGHYPGTLMPKNILPGLNSIGFGMWMVRQIGGRNPTGTKELR